MIVLTPEGRWEFVRALYTASSMSDAAFKHDFTLLIILLMISILTTVEHSDICISDQFVNPAKELPVLMEGLWETWKTQRVDHHVLVGIAIWLLKGSSSSPFRPYAFQQQRMFQELLNAYDSYTGGSTFLMTSNALQLIEAALLSSFKTAKDTEWEPETVDLRNPWLIMHIHNILRRDWYSLRGTMSEAVLDRLGPLTQLNQHNPEQLEQLDLPGWHNPPVQQSSTALKVIAGLRLNLYNAKILRLDPIPLALFLFPRNEDIYNDSRRLILEFFRSTPDVPSPLPDAIRLEKTEYKSVQEICCDFFDSTAAAT